MSLDPCVVYLRLPYEVIVDREGTKELRQLAMSLASRTGAGFLLSLLAGQPQRTQFVCQRCAPRGVDPIGGESRALRDCSVCGVAVPRAEAVRVVA